MSVVVRLFVLSVSLLWGSTQAGATVGAVGCIVCTCQNEAVICLDTTFMEVLEEQGACGTPCAGIGSTFQSSELIETTCDNLSICDHVQAPATSPLWLSGAAIALLLLGGVTLRRLRFNTAS